MGGVSCRDPDQLRDDHQTKPEQENEEVQEEQPAQENEVGDNCRAKVTFDLLEMGVPQLIAKDHSQATLDLWPVLEVRGHMRYGNGVRGMDSRR